ncbi:MAG: hypothetical protein JST80_13175 [Bdellovibrionales bacterium]|nr:hypothetical protein [Bdellovibrionales bacterium]
MAVLTTTFALDAEAANKKKSHKHHGQKHAKHLKHARKSTAQAKARKPAQIVVARKGEAKHEVIDMTVDPRRPLTWDE